MNLESHLPPVLDLCLKSSAILLAAFGVAWLVRKASAARRHLVWLATFITLAILPLTLAIPPRWSWSWQHPAAARPAILTTPPAAIRKLPDAPAEAASARSALRLPGWPAIVGGAWLAGALLLLARQAAGFWRLRALRRRSFAITSGPVAVIAAEFGGAELRDSPLCAVPLTWGWRHSVVLLPGSASSWPEAQLRAALAHEFGHIARRDFLWRQVAQIVRAFFWPNPLVWLAVRALHRTQEQACDDLVLGRGASPREYAMQLLEAARTLAAPMFTPSQAVAMALPSTLEGRVRAIVDEQRDRRAPGCWSRISAVATVVVVIAGSAFAQVKFPPSEKPAAPQVLIDVKFIEVPDDAIDPADFPGNLASKRADVLLKKLTAKTGVDVLSAPRVTTRSGQRAIIEIANAPSPPGPGIKFEATPRVSENGLEIEVDFTATRTTVDEDRKIDGTPVAKTRVVKSKVKLASGQTCIFLSHAEGKDRPMLIAVTASIVDDHALPPPKKEEPAKLEYGKAVRGKEGFVTSPYAPEAGFIDVRGFPPDTEIKDPYTGKIFLVPDSSPVPVPPKPGKPSVQPAAPPANAGANSIELNIVPDAIEFEGFIKDPRDGSQVQATPNVINSEKSFDWRPAGAEKKELLPMGINPFGTISVNGIEWVASAVVSADGTAKTTGKALRYDAENREFTVEMKFGKKVTGWVETGKVRAK